MKKRENQDLFCRAYLRTMNPEQAAAESGVSDGFALLNKKEIQKCLETMRAAATGQLRREDVLWRLAQLAFGRANDPVLLALHPESACPAALDLSALSELKVTDKGVEIKLVDRIRALETLCGLLESGQSCGAEELYKALAEAGEEWRDE